MFGWVLCMKSAAINLQALCVLRQCTRTVCVRLFCWIFWKYKHQGSRIKVGRKLCYLVALIPVFGSVNFVKGCLNERKIAFVVKSFQQKCLLQKCFESLAWSCLSCSDLHLRVSWCKVRGLCDCLLGFNCVWKLILVKCWLQKPCLNKIAEA